MKKEIPEQNYENLKKYCLENLRLDLFGVAEIREIRSTFSLAPGLADRYDYAVSLGKEVLLPSWTILKTRQLPFISTITGSSTFFLTGQRWNSLL